MAQRTNRGPGAAAENRAALISAAREIFADRGARAPMSAIAREAGVSQAVLYRHFPTRESLAMALFEQNMARVEEAAAQPGARLRDITDLITHQIQGSAAVIGLFARDEHAPVQRELYRRLRLALQPVLERAIESGEVRRDATLDELVLSVGAVSALVTTAAPENRTERAAAAWALILRGLGPR